MDMEDIYLGRCLFIKSEKKVLRFLMGRGKKWFSLLVGRNILIGPSKLKVMLPKTRLFELFGGHCNVFF